MRLKVLLDVKGLGMFGDVRGEFAADVTTAKTLVPSLITRLEGREKEVPFIPGSQIKGSLRSIAVSVYKLLLNRGIVTLGSKVFTKCMGALKTSMTTGGMCDECLVGLVFGYSGVQVSPLRVSNFYPIRVDANIDVLRAKKLYESLSCGDTWDKPPIEYVTRVRIDRCSGVSKEGALYTYEHIPCHTRFLGEIEFSKEILDSNIKGGLNASQVYVEGLRLILASLAQLNYEYIGRRTRCKVTILFYQPPDVGKDEYVKALLDKLTRV